MDKKSLFIIFLVALSFGIAFYFYPQMGEKMASHWNIDGNVDGYMSKFWGLFLLPIILLFLNLFLVFVPKIDPEKKNIKMFEGSYGEFIVVINIFMFYLYILTLIWNLGREFSMSTMLMPAFAMLFYFSGSLIGKAKRNYTIGIRLPWTLASEEVWNKTHKRGEKLFKLVAIIILLGFFLPPQYAFLTFLFLFVPLILSTIYLAVFSYMEYQKVK